VRAGIGYDIHRLTPGRALILGGVTIEHSHGLDGHSDADVILHAMIDAMLGAAGLGDIGLHFPPTDEQFRDVSSLELLEKARSLVHSSGYRVLNVDATVVAELPHLQPHAERMREAIGRVLGISPAQINIKATTNEGMGPEGRQEAISAQAIVLLKESE
jgi:2-C-methyl-D-erythritol 2,4-cyclodiphosphate synthase